jgi:hypothetical protein
MENIVKKFSDALTAACYKSFKTDRAFFKTKHKTVSWWTEELTIAKKRVNAFRRKHQRTNNDDNYATNAKLNIKEKRLDIKQK